MTPDFPIEFSLPGTPVSLQAKRATSKTQWKAAVRSACASALFAGHWACTGPISITLFYFPSGEMQGDIDNIVKLILDALCGYVYIDDAQVERVLVQKFEPGRTFTFTSPSPLLATVMALPKPCLYVRISDDPHEELR